MNSNSVKENINVSIYRAKDMVFLCGGTLIDQKHILSAAHCYMNYRHETLIASIGKLLKIKKASDGYVVDKLFIHEHFTPNCYCNDIAVLRLRVRLGHQHVPACFGKHDTASVGENTTVLGWGDRKYVTRGQAGTNRLQRLDHLPIESSKECRKIISRLLHRKLPKDFEKYYMCAGVPDGSKDACSGDSGGPLLHQSYDGSWTLLGVVSFGYKCGEPGVPATYSRVSYYMPWILKKIES